jgi:hypothetical protein
MDPTITDEQVQQLAATARPASLVVLRWAPDRFRDGADAIEREHQRRMIALRAGGTIAVLCPVASDAIAGVAVLTVTQPETDRLMAEDPCVRAGMMTYDALACATFPGDAIPV